MIKTWDITPQSYYKESRDFQFIGRLYESIFNYNKCGIDLVRNVPYSKNIDNRLMDLVLRTIGFNPKHYYEEKTLKLLINSFKLIIQNKGNVQSIERIIKVLLKSLNNDSNCLVTYDNNECIVKIYIPLDSNSVILLDDIMDYILPTGWLYEIYLGVVDSTYSTTPLIANDKLKVQTIGTGDTSKVSGSVEKASIWEGYVPMTMVVGEKDKQKNNNNRIIIDTISSNTN